MRDASATLFVMLSLLIRMYCVTLAIAEVTHTRKSKEKNNFLWLFARLFVTLAIAEVTHTRKSKEKNNFLWLFARLIVTLHVFKRL